MQIFFFNKSYQNLTFLSELENEKNWKCCNVLFKNLEQSAAFDSFEKMGKII